ncbi:hypothetical protein VTN31DRAFT_7350 [Thermomyces dupontii]|uniref:uncharacterized protein n=1 Tax=Talaromyces thermophilus TaxID=28565 RepID=UPI003743DA7B
MASSRPSPPQERRPANSTRKIAPLQPSPIPLQPIENVPAARKESSTAQKPSPKSSRRPGSAHSNQGSSLQFVSITAPSPPTFATDSPAKRQPQGRSHRRTPSVPSQTTFNTFPSRSSPSDYGQSSQSTGSNEAAIPNPSMTDKPAKRTLMEAAPVRERPAKKPKREEPVELPEPHEMPPIEDDGSKPPYSYATLIGMSLLRAPNRRLTLSQIYKWISDTFSYYRNGDSGWQNSIRHNLSLNKAFVKQERPKDDPGKGNYWSIEPGMEAQFLKDKPVRRATMSSTPMPPTTGGKDAGMQTVGTTSMWSLPPPAPPVEPKPQGNAGPSTTNSRSYEPQDLSSDATLPASDPALLEDSGEDEGRAPAVSQAPRSSPPPMLHSSPPVAPPRFFRQGTPSSPSRGMPSSRKRRSGAMNDSGYFSSLESSAMRPQGSGHILTSELDIEPPRIKRGRAEEEIARIRSSSHDISPLRARASRSGQVPAMGTSSPVREEYVNPLPPPLTPVIKFKKPAKPPPSVSPNTNLRNHRRKIQQMVQSPIKNLGLTDEELPWSPAFKIDETTTPSDNLHAQFDIFADPTADVPTPGLSPVKHPGSAQGLTDNALNDITSSSANKRLGLTTTATSASKTRTVDLDESPLKMLDPSPYEPGDDFFSFNFFDDSPTEIDGIDLLQGFQKIGGASRDATCS